MTDVPRQDASRPTRRWLLFVLTLLVVLIPVVAGVTDTGVPFRNDFAAYWPVGRLLLTGQNPYDGEAIAALQRSVGDSLGGDSVVRYPPWSLPLLLPFAVLPYAPGWYLWIFLQVLLVAISSVWMWNLYNQVDGQRSALAIGLMYPPSLIMALGGQIGGLLLFAVTLFLWASDRHRDVVAGICLGVLATKPHLFMPFAVVVLLWAAHERRVLVPAVAVVTIAIGALVTVSLRPGVFPEYLQFIQSRAPTGYLPVTLGGLVRLIGGSEKFWLQWIPSVAVLALIPLAWSRFSKRWTWAMYGPGILALGLASAPYGLVHDLVLLIPCLVFVAVLVRQRASSGLKRLTFWGYFVVCLGIWVGQVWRGTSFVQVWVAPLVLLVCVTLRWDDARSSRGAGCASRS
jgi:hypothetical protein